MAEQIKVLEDIINLIRTTKGELNGVRSAIVEISKEARNSQKAFQFTTPKEVSTQLKQNAQFTEQLNAEIKEQERLEKALINQIAKKQLAMESTNKALIKHRYETQQLNKLQKEEAVLTSKLSTFYQKLNVRMNKAGREIQSLVAKKSQLGSLSKQEEADLAKLTLKYNQYRASIDKADIAIKRHNRNVGNYGSALKGLGANLRTLVSAFGFTGGIYLFAQGVRDAFNRIREFDKSMQNLSGVFRVTRKDLKDLEETIISVAGETVRTSNEVAELAETLATLGKSPEQIENLLKPVIDLSLGLNAAADEAGEFLVQMLNAFGGTEAEASKYADTIATIRTSTTLDFQKMRDSFQYIAPISRLLGKDLAYTGSVVGILADNSLKAEQAGRLLSTAQIKLATQGKTLDDALQEINKAYKEGADSLEILSLSNDLFGKQASKVGAILALNTDAIETNAQAIRDNGGALKDLTDRQLESFDAKMKILDSTYERFLLTVEKGDGVIGKFLVKRIENATDMLSSLSFGLGETGTKMQRATVLFDGFQKAFSYFAPIGLVTQELVDDTAESIKNMNFELEESTQKLQDTNAAFIKLHGTLAPFTQEQQELIDKQKEINELFGSTLNEALSNGAKRTINDINADLKEQNELLYDTDTGNTILIKSIRAKIKVLEAERDAILGTNKARKAANKKREETIEIFAKLKESAEEARLQFVKTFSDSEMSAGEFEEKLSKIDKAIADISEGMDAVQSGDLLEGLVPDGDGDGIGDRLNIIIASAQEEISGFQQMIDEIGWDGFIDKASAALSEVGNLVSTLYDGKIQRIDDAINANDLYYANLLDNENLSVKQRAAIEAEQERKRLELEKKKREEQRKQAIANKAFGAADVIINTAVAISKASPIVPLMAFAAATGALQLATVLAQPIPQFEHGLDHDYEGKGVINDQKGSKYKELVFRKSGKVEMFNQRNKVIDIKKGDRIAPAGLSHDIMQQTIAMNMSHQNEQLSAYQKHNVDKEILNAIQKLQSPTNNITVTPAPLDTAKIAKEMWIMNEANKA